MSRDQFLKRFKEIVGEPPEKNPLFSRGDDGSYDVSTEGAAHLAFIKIKGTFKFIAYIVESWSNALPKAPLFSKGDTS